MKVWDELHPRPHIGARYKLTDGTTVEVRASWEGGLVADNRQVYDCERWASLQPRAASVAAGKTARTPFIRRSGLCP